MKSISSLRENLLALQPRLKLLIVILADGLIALSATIVAMLLTSWDVRATTQHDFLWIGATTLTIVLSLSVFRAYRAVARFFSLGIVGRIFAAYLAAATVLLVVRVGLAEQALRFNTLVLLALLGAVGSASLRLLAFTLLRAATLEVAGGRVIIYGAGKGGVQLAVALQMSQTYRTVAFVDDRLDLQNRTLLGLPIYSPSLLPQLKARDGFDQIFLAIPSATRSRKREILEGLENLAVKIRVVPGVEEIASGKKKVDELRDVQIEDLLGRDPVAPIPELIDAYIRAQAVLVTGAGGSIGSELCRQIASLGVRKLVLFDMSEFALYSIHRELLPIAQQRGFELVPVLGSVTESRIISRVISRHVVDTVYHAAAYKHVPLVEGNISSAVHNNVFGTLYTVQAALGGLVKNFVLVSTDKAVRPTSIMGASKRVCELIVQAYAEQNPQTRMAMVRFGNVLASSGSVVPLFNEQIRAGGPITVTDPEVTRYFMTIPEAAQLVLQAGALGRSGEVFVLDMNKPIKIRELAERMVHLSGLQLKSEKHPHGDIELHYTGLRPGEKLYEELLVNDNPQPTQHQRIFLARERFIGLEPLSHRLRKLLEYVVMDAEPMIRGELRQMVEGFGISPAAARPGRQRTVGNEHEGEIESQSGLIPEFTRDSALLH